MVAAEKDRRLNGDLNGFHIPENALCLLDEIAEDQQARVVSGAYEEFGADSRIGLLRAFERSEFFPALYNRLVRLAYKIPDNARFVQIARGRIFETIAYAHHAANQPKGLILLSPRDTGAFMNLVYGGATFIDEEGNPAVDGRYVPDGIQVRVDRDPTELVRVYDYKLHRGDIESQLTGFWYLKRELKSISAEEGITMNFIYPSGRSGYPSTTEANIGTLPLSDEAFSPFAEYMIMGYRATQDSATLAEIREEYSRQLQANNHPAEYGEPAFFRK